MELIGGDRSRPWPGTPRTVPHPGEPGVRYLGPAAVVRSLARGGTEPEGLRPRPGDRMLVVEEPLLPGPDSPAVREPLYLSLDRAVLWSARPVTGTGWELTVSDFRDGVGTERSVVVAAPTPAELDTLVAAWGWVPAPGSDGMLRAPGPGAWIVAVYTLGGETIAGG